MGPAIDIYLYRNGIVNYFGYEIAFRYKAPE